MVKSKRRARTLAMVIATIAGLSLVALLVTSFEVQGETLMNELVAVIILVIVLIAAAFLTAIGLSAIRNRRSRSDRNGDEDEKDDEDED